jgi:hypothetical protein
LKIDFKSVVSVLLSYEPERINQAEEQILPRQGQDRSLIDAANDFRRVLYPNGEIYGQENEVDRSEQCQIIEAEARRIGFLYDGLEPVVEGGREHDLTFDAATGTVLKFTKPSSSAYVVEFMDAHPRLMNADPLEYLNRLILHNQVFGDFTSFVGIGGYPRHRRIITRQISVKGREARWEEIVRLMVEDLGFTKLRHNFGIGYEDSYGFVRDDVAVFDMRPANLFTTESGDVIAVDSIPVRLDDLHRTLLMRF